MVNRGLSGPQTYCDTGQKKRILPLPAATIQFLGCRAHTAVTTPKFREPWNDSSKHILENSGLQKSWILNKCLCHAPSSKFLKSTLKSNIWFKRKFPDRRSIRHETRIVTIHFILLEWFGNAFRWSSEGLKLLFTCEGEVIEEGYRTPETEEQNQHFCFQLPTYCQEASIYCF